jgi:hypothetical protein
MAQALDVYLEDESADRGWHHHVGAGECELTIAIDSSSTDGATTIC